MSRVCPMVCVSARLSPLLCVFHLLRFVCYLARLTFLPPLHELKPERPAGMALSRGWLRGCGDRLDGRDNAALGHAELIGTPLVVEQQMHMQDTAAAGKATDIWHINMGAGDVEECCQPSSVVPLHTLLCSGKLCQPLISGPWAPTSPSSVLYEAVSGSISGSLLSASVPGSESGTALARPLSSAAAADRWHWRCPNEECTSVFRSRGDFLVHLKTAGHAPTAMLAAAAMVDAKVTQGESFSCHACAVTFRKWKQCRKHLIDTHKMARPSPAAYRVEVATPDGRKAEVEYPMAADPFNAYRQRMKPSMQAAMAAAKAAAAHLLEEGRRAKRARLHLDSSMLPKPVAVVGVGAAVVGAGGAGAGGAGASGAPLPSAETAAAVAEEAAAKLAARVPMPETPTRVETAHGTSSKVTGSFSTKIDLNSLPRVMREQLTKRLYQVCEQASTRFSCVVHLTCVDHLAHLHVHSLQSSGKLRAASQETITRATNVAVRTRGQFLLNPPQPVPAAPNAARSEYVPAKEPLHLHLTAFTIDELDKAVAMIRLYVEGALPKALAVDKAVDKKLAKEVVAFAAIAVAPAAAAEAPAPVVISTTSLAPVTMAAAARAEAAAASQAAAAVTPAAVAPASCASQHNCRLLPPPRSATLRPGLPPPFRPAYGWTPLQAPQQQLYQQWLWQNHQLREWPAHGRPPPVASAPYWYSPPPPSR